jgi:hypothetical protein
VRRWGEEFVRNYLQHTLASQRVDWVNKSRETGSSYDIKVMHRTAKTVEFYVEVKATASSEKTLFELSNREWLFAQQEGGRYYIYRVYGAGSPPAATIVRIHNPYLQWRTRDVGMCFKL